MRRYVILNKEIGETPLQTLEAWRERHPRYSTVPISYAGRLDPMASGKLLLLLGEECKQQKKYTALDKEYVIEILLDIGSDTGDILGLVEATDTHTDLARAEIDAVLKQEEGAHERQYPIFSSKTVNGKPLFWYALTHTLDSIAIPFHTETITSIRVLQKTSLSSTELSERITSLLARVPTSDEPSKKLGANFRVADVISRWKPIFKEKRTYGVLTLQVRCGHGTYMRSLAGRIGESLGTRALALSIHRTHIFLPLRLQFPILDSHNVHR